MAIIRENPIKTELLNNYDGICGNDCGHHPLVRQAFERAVDAVFDNPYVKSNLKIPSKFDYVPEGKDEEVNP